MRVKDKVAIVTGAARGLGKAIALTLAREGADVIIWDIDDESADQTAEEIVAMRKKGLAMVVDVVDSAQVNEAAEKVLGEFGRVDILVNNAGIARPAPTLMDLSDEQWNKEVGIMLTGTFYCTRAVLTSMIERRAGKIINISSIRALVLAPNISAGYASAKAGVLGLTMAVAGSVAQYGINVNAICPGTIHTDILKSFTPDQLKTLESALIFNKGGKPGAHGSPQDVADAVLFLASGESDYITGTRIIVSGGQAGNLIG
jgi:NAD(P)-dependent dehydrogenase (short-subunit alcohol dehydrogenase family)